MSGRDWVKFSASEESIKQLMARVIKVSTGEDVDTKFLTMEEGLGITFLTKWRMKSVYFCIRRWGDDTYSLFWGPERHSAHKPYAHAYPDAMSLVESMLNGSYKILDTRTMHEHWAHVTGKSIIGEPSYKTIEQQEKEIDNERHRRK